MNAAPAVVAHRINRPDDLPEEVFEQILFFLTFKEKVIARRVCKSWFRVAHYLFKRQTSVKICVTQRRKSRKDEYHEWRSMRTCCHVVDSGFRVTFDTTWVDCKDTTYQENEDVVTRVTSCLAFIGNNFDSIVVAELSCTLEPAFGKPDITYELTNFVFAKDDLVRLRAACNRFVSKYQHQLRCLHCNMLTVTTDHCFPQLVHLTCKQISDDIRNIFLKITPKLCTLNCLRCQDGSECMHIDNYAHLPEDFNTITFRSGSGHYDQFRNFHSHGPVNRRILQQVHGSRCREQVHTVINVRIERVEHDVSFPNLRCLRGWECGHVLSGNSILTANASNLLYLELNLRHWQELHFRPGITLHNLHSLILVDCSCAQLPDILSCTTDRLRQVHLSAWFGDEKLLQAMDSMCQLKSLRFLKAFFTSLENGSTYVPDEKDVESGILRLLNAPSRATLTFLAIDVIRVNFRVRRPTSPLILAQVELMKRDASLEAAFFKL